MEENERVALYLRQKELLDTFLSTGAITKRQYDKSLSDLTEKMGMKEVLARAGKGKSPSL